MNIDAKREFWPARATAKPQDFHLSGRLGGEMIDLNRVLDIVNGAVKAWRAGLHSIRYHNTSKTQVLECFFAEILDTREDQVLIGLSDSENNYEERWFSRSLLPGQELEEDEFQLRILQNTPGTYSIEFRTLNPLTEADIEAARLELNETIKNRTTTIHD